MKLRKKNADNHNRTKDNNAEDKIITVGLEKGKTILYVEDNIFNQEIMEGALLRKGYKYIPAYNGKEALELLETNNIDLVLMDIQLPELNGFEATKIIRDKKENTRQIPIIGMSAYSIYEYKSKCIELGMNEYIAKPFNLEELYNILESYLGR